MREHEVQREQLRVVGEHTQLRGRQVQVAAQSRLEQVLAIAGQRGRRQR